MEDAIKVGPEQLQAMLALLLGRHPTTEERVAAVRSTLESQAGRIWRAELGKWVTWLVPVEELVPEVYEYWRPLVQDAMQFVVSRLSPARLAPKVVEQMELPPDTPAEKRLLSIIARVPGLQKIGQVLARNRYFQPRFRRALIELENGISDVGIAEMRALILKELGPRIDAYRVRIHPAIFSEASVSAVIRFTWRNPETGRRERGVFKVLKPHIPSCYAEDMKIIQQLAGFLARRYMADSSRFSGLADTLSEIRLLLAHEVDFRREQSTLPVAGAVYGSLPGVRVPRLIEPLSTDIITALSYETGVKVTSAKRRQSALRHRLAERMVEILFAMPALGRRKQTVFHADPHAGNLLYDTKTGELVILDWALTESLTLEQRRRVALLVFMTVLRDPDGMRKAIDGLRQRRPADEKEQQRRVRVCVSRFLNALPISHIPGAMDAMNLLDEAAREGVRFPAPLAMFRKAVFTLEGVVEDVAGSAVQLDAVLIRYAAKHWLATGAALWSMLSAGDLLSLEWSVLTFPSRVSLQAAVRPWRWLLTQPAAG